MADNTNDTPAPKKTDVQDPSVTFGDAGGDKKIDAVNEEVSLDLSQDNGEGAMANMHFGTRPEAELLKSEDQTEELQEGDVALSLIGSDPSLETATLAENVEGAVVGTLASYDAADAVSYSVSDDRFEVVGGELRLIEGVSVDFETAASLDVTVTATNADGVATDETISIDVVDVNEAPFGLDLEGSSVAENAPGAVIGTLSSFDPDSGDTVTYTVSDDRFEVVDGELRLAEGVSLDHEEAASIDVMITATDGDGLSTTETFSIDVVDVNEGPSNLNLDGATVAENADGAVVGTLSSFDPDADDTATYSVSDDRFEVVDGDLRLVEGASLDHEVAETIQVSVTVTDSEGLSSSETFDVTVADVNEGPSDLALDGSSVAENVEGGVFGTLSSFDPDAGDSVTYTVSDERFEVVDGELRLADGVSLDHEDTASIDVEVTVTDSEGLSSTETFEINVADVNEGPSDLALDGSSVAENSEGAVIGTLSSFDPDADDTATYTVSDDRFEVVDGELRLAEGVSLDHEAAESIDVSVTVTDSEGLSTTETFAVDVQDVNEGPTDLALDGSSVAENSEGAVVGTLSSFDPDASDSVSYSVSDDRFEVVDGELRLAEGVSLNHEEIASIQVDVTATDQDGLSTTETFDIDVTDINEGPTDLALDGDTVAENSEGAVIGTLSSFDPDAGDTATYTVSDDRFEVVDGELRLAEGVSLDHEAAETIDVEVTVTDSEGLASTETFEVNVADVNEGPSDLALDGNTVAENSEGGVVGTLSSFDPDAGDTVEYSVSDDRFEVVDGELRLAEGVSLDHEEVESLQVEVTATDSEGLSVTENFDINVADVNEAPTDLTLTLDTTTAEADFSAADGYNGTDVQNLGLESDQIVFTMSFTTGDDVDAAQTLFETGGSGTGTNVVINDGMLEIYAGQGNDLELSVPIEAGTSYNIALGLDLDGDTIKLLMSDELDLSEMNESNSLVASHDEFTDRDYSGGNNMAVGDDSGNAQGRVGGEFQGTIEGPGLEIYSDATFEDVFIEAGVNENSEGAVVGSISAFDPDAGDSLSYTVSDDRFEVVDGELRLAEGVTLDHEVEAEIDVTVTATDEGGLSTSETFTVDVVDVNEGPTDLSLDNNSIDENTTEGVVGTVSVTDPDAGDTHTYSLVDGEGLPFAIDADTGEISLVSPGIPEGSVLHIDASETGGLGFGDSVSSIQDLSGENNSIAQSDTNDQPTLIEDGPFGQPGLSFDGANDRLDIADDAKINLSSQGERSFALTIKTGEDVESRQVIYEEGGTVNGFNFYIDDGELYMGAWSESTGWDFQSVSVEVEPGESYSVSAVYDGASGTYTGYVNGEEIGSVEVGDTMSGHSGNIGLGGIAQHTVFHDGDSSANEGFYFEGSVGEFVVFNEALDSGEIAGIDMDMRGIDPQIDFETQDSYDLTVQVTDAAGESYQEVVTIDVNDLNEGPSDLELDGSSVAENADGAVVGTLSSFDPDAGDSVTYSVSDDRFEVVDGDLQLVDGVSLDHEAAETIQVEVTATDSEGLSTTESFDIDVADVNEGPSDLALDGDTVAENSEGAVVGTLSSFDPDAGDTVEYTVSDDRFEVVDGDLRLADGVSLDHEEAAAIQVEVTATDGEGLSTSESFDINVADVNEAPTNIELSAAPDAFLEQDGLLVIEAENYDGANAGDAHAWRESDAHDGMMHVDDGANAYDMWRSESDVENDSPELSYSIHIDTPGTYFVHVLGAAEDGPRGNADSVHIGIDGDRITGDGGLTGFGSDAEWGARDTYTGDVVEVTFDSAGTHELNLWAREDGVSVDQIVLTQDPNFDPEAQTLEQSPRASDMGIVENDAGAVVGTLSSFDPDAGDSVIYTVSDDRFEVVDGELRLADGESLNHEEAATLDIEVTATDSGGLTTSETFTIDVVDVNEGPTDLALDNTTVAENSEGAVVGTLSSFDPDAGDSVTYSVSDDRFEVVDGDLRLADGVSLDHEEAASIQVEVTATDSDGASTTENFDIEVTDLNEAPSDLSLSGTDGVLSLNQDGGTDDNAISSNVTDFPTDAITVEVTFTADGMPDGSGAPLFSYAAGGGGGNDVLLWGESSSGNLAVFLDGQKFGTDISNSDLFDGDEHTLSFTWDQDSGDLNVFVDGDLEYSRSVNISGIEADGTITLGQEQDREGGSYDSNQVFQGEISEVRIYDEALSEEQVADNASGDVAQDGLVTHWDMSEAEGGVVSDLAGGNDLVLENGAEITQGEGVGVASIDENAEGAVVGTVSAFDPDDGDSVSYTVSDDRFEVVDGELRLADGESLDHEAAESLDITVTVTDSGGLETSETFSINVNDVNEAPTDLTFETGAENLIMGGSFEQQDVRTGGWRGFSEDTSGNWETENGIEIWDNLWGSEAADGAQFVELDYTGAEDAISQTVTTEPGQVYTLSLDVKSRGAATTDTIEIYWNGELVDAVDPGSTDWETVSFDLVGTGGEDVLEFREAEGESDGYGAHLDNVSLIEVPLTVAEGAEGAVFGTFSASDPDEGDAVTFSVDDPRFEIVDGELRLADGESLDYEDASSVDVVVTATDADGLETSETVTINVADVDDTPTVTTSQKTVTETAEVANDEITTSNGGGSETSTVVLGGSDADSSEIVIDFGRIDNSFEIEINGQPLTDETIQLQENVFDDSSEVMLVFEDGTPASTPWVPSDDGSPRFQVVVTEDSVEIFGTRTPGSDELEPMSLEGGEFNSIDLVEGENAVTVINPDGDGPDGLEATVSASYEAVVDVQTVTGTDGDDSISGSDGEDVLIGGDGNDLFIFDADTASANVDGGEGWTDTIDLSAATDNGAVYGDDWTVTLTEGEIVSEDAESLTLTDDSAGFIEFENGNTIEFDNIDQIGF